MLEVYKKFHQTEWFKNKSRIYEKKKRRNGKRREWELKNKDKIQQYRQQRKGKTHKINKKEWSSCLDYFDHKCAYCGMTEKDHKKVYGQQLHKEHVDHEGKNDLSNCVPSCKICNTSKHTAKLKKWYKRQKFFTEERLNKIHNWIEKEWRKYYIEKKPRKSNKAAISYGKNNKM